VQEFPPALLLKEIDMSNVMKVREEQKQKADEITDQLIKAGVHRFPASRNDCWRVLSPENLHRPESRKS
jgi:hypothetical protein